MELRGFVCDLATSENGCIGVQKDKERRRREEFAALAEQRGQRFFDLPEFTFWAVSQSRRVEDKTIVGAAAADFARDEGLRVVDEPADGAVGELRESLIFTSPLDGFAGGVPGESFFRPPVTLLHRMKIA
jgi:hypothetical protein